MTTNPDTGVALAHDSFTQLGGAERVFQAIYELYPGTEVYTLVMDKNLKAQLPSWRIHTSFLQNVYNFYPRFQHLFPLIPLALKFFRVGPAKVLVSSSSAYIKGLRKPPGSVHLNYCHTPTRFLWVDPQHAYNEVNFLLRPLARLYFSWLKRWDLAAAKRVDVFVANSTEVQTRIKSIYGRHSEIIYPFVDVTFWKPTRSDKGDYFLVGGRLQRAKGLDQVIRVFNELDLPLHVIGTGRYEQQLRLIAGSKITFLGRIADEQLRDEYSGARGFIYPQFEDFGMMPLEAAACGTATLALARGGSLETVLSGVTGELFPVATEESLKALVINWGLSKYSQLALQNHAAKFSKEVFQSKMKIVIEKARQS